MSVEKAMLIPPRKRGELTMMDQPYAAPLEAYPSIQVRVLEWVHWYLSEMEKKP
jgi:hypothetical protein